MSATLVLARSNGIPQRGAGRWAFAPLAVFVAGAAMLLGVRAAGSGAPRGDDGVPPGEPGAVAPAFANPALFDAGSRRTSRGYGDLSVLAGDPTLGGAGAQITIVVFSDFQCPFCGRVESTLKSLQGSYPGNVRFVWKDYPLPFHDQAKPAAIAARTVLLARGSAAFWTAHDTLFARQRQIPEAIKAVYADLGLDDATVRRLAPEATRLVEDATALGGEIGVSGTPCFFIDGEMLSGAQPASAFAEVIDRHLVEVRSLLAAGTPPTRVYDAMLARHRVRDAGP
jgi:protein-disulfide isomerase